MTRYSTIVADPPWNIDVQGSMPGRAYSARSVVRTPPPYETLDAEYIADLDVPGLAATDATLFLWATSRHLRPAFDVLDGWGFTYSQLLTWRKTGDPSPLTGWIAPTSHAEYVLVGRRGKPTLRERLPSCVFEAPRPRHHSAKPDVFLDMVEATCEGPYLEMFARRARMGWDYFGDESLGTAELPERAA